MVRLLNERTRLDVGERHGRLPRYCMYGVTIESEIELPSESNSGPEAGSGPCDLYVRNSLTPLKSVEGIRWSAKRSSSELRVYDVYNGLLLCVAEDIRIHIPYQGKTVTVDALESQRSEVALYLTGTVLALYFMLRGAIPLHAAGVELGGKTVGIMAPSGTGKSTLLWYLQNRGARFISDDILPIHIVDGQPFLEPSGSLHSRLWGETLRAFFMDFTNSQRIIPHIDKYWVPVRQESRLATRKKLDVLVSLQPENGMRDHKPVARRERFGRLPLLIENTHSIWAAPESVYRELLPTFVALASGTPLYSIGYVKRMASLPWISKLIMEVLAGDGTRKLPHKAFSSQSL